MALDFPSSPTNGQVYGNYYYDASIGAWSSFATSSNIIPSTLKNLTITSGEIGLVPLTVTGKSGQTANLQEWISGAGSGVASLTNAGTLTVQTLNLTNDLTVENGGTGVGTFTAGAYLKGNGTSAIQAQTGVPFADVTVIPINAAADLNTYITQGLYHQNANVDAAGGANYPVPYAGLLEVINGEGFIYQRYTVYQEQHAIWTRSRYITTWSAWQQVPTGTVTVGEGGTGATTLTSGAYLKGAGTSAITSQIGIPATDITSGQLGYGIVPVGSVLQVLSKTDTTAYSAGVAATTWYTWPSSRLALAITPKFATSKILIMVNVSLGNSLNDAGFRITRNGSSISIGDVAGSRPRATGITGMLYSADQNHTIRMVTSTFLDSPATTAATTYNVDYISEGTTMYLNRVASYPDANTTYAATVTSTITLMEIAG